MYPHGFEVPKTSETVAHVLVERFESLPAPLNFSGDFIEEGSRCFDRDESCGQLGMKRHGWYHYTLMMELVSFVKSLSLLQRYSQGSIA